MYEYQASVLRVVDGDTLDLMIDLGLDVRIRVRVRLEGVNAPEMGTAAGWAARQFVVQWLNTTAPPAETQPVIVTTTKDRREKYGRYLATIRNAAADAPSLNSELVRAGHAVPSKG